MSTSQAQKIKSNPKKAKKAAKRREREYRDPLNTAYRNMRKEKQRADSHPGIQKTLTGRGSDINAPARDRESLVQQISVPNLIDQIPVTATVNRKTISNLALGIVLHALKNGLGAAFTSDQTNPYYMFRFLEDTFTQAMQGTFPAIQQAPVWFWELLTAIRPRQSPFKLGSVKYEWDFVDSDVTSASPIAMGIASAQYYVAIGPHLSGIEILGFPAIGPNSIYSPDLGAKAVDNLWAFVKGSAAMTKLTANPEAKYLSNDTSAFSAVYPELGGSFDTPCAQRATIYSERNIDSPILAKFAEYQPASASPVGAWRGWHKVSVSGGSAGMIGPTLATMEHREEIRSKVPPIVKFYNFDEFFEVLSLTLGKAMSPQLSTNGNPVSPCPLSPLQAQILLRQTMLPLFSNELHQDLRVTQTSSVPMLPFTVGMNGLSVGTKMQLPTCLAENIRACKSFFNPIRKGDPRSTIRVYSILGRPYEIPQLGNYYVDGTNNAVQVYSAEGSTEINLIDCSTTQGNTQYFLDFSAEQIEILAQNWNGWIKEFSNRLSPLVQIGGAAGISMLHTATLTNWQSKEVVLNVPTPVAPALAKQHSSSKLVKIPGLPKVRLGAGGPDANGYFNTIVERQVTSLQCISAPQWRYLSLWILPVTIAAGNAVDEQSLQCWQAFFMEVNRVPRSGIAGVTSGVVGNPISPTSAYDRHVSMALVDVKAFAADQAENMIDELTSLGEKGRGGFISAIASLLGPAIQAFADV